MNYVKIYNSIIDKSRAATRCKLEKTDKNYAYYEIHHIVPKSLGGSDDIENLVLLTPKEHMICHLLLVKIYPESLEMVRAAILMGSDRYGNRIGCRQYDWLRKRFSQFPGPNKGIESKRKNRKFGPNKGRGKKMGNTESYFGRTPWNKGIKTGIGGPKKAQERVICPKCDLEGGIQNMKRYHFDNCRPYTFGKQKGNKNAKES